MNFIYYKCKELIYSDHAVAQMFRRDISLEEVDIVIKSGETLKSYPDDKPFPSYLLLGFIEQRPIHLVIALDEKMKKCIVITAYEPDSSIWSAGFKVKI